MTPHGGVGTTTWRC